MEPQGSQTYYMVAGCFQSEYSKSRGRKLKGFFADSRTSFLPHFINQTTHYVQPRGKGRKIRLYLLKGGIARICGHLLSPLLNKVLYIQYGIKGLIRVSSIIIAILLMMKLKLRGLNNMCKDSLLINDASQIRTGFAWLQNPMHVTALLCGKLGC